MPLALSGQHLEHRLDGLGDEHICVQEHNVRVAGLALQEVDARSHAADHLL